MPARPQNPSDNPLGIPLMERTAEQVRAVFSGEPAEIVSAAVKLHAYAAREKLGVTKLAHHIRISGGSLSQFFNHTYPGDYTAIAERIEKFFWRLEQKALYGGLRQFVKTSLAGAMWSIFEMTRVVRRIQILQSPEQVGKTRAAVQYAEENNSGRTHYVTLSGGSRSGAGDFIWDLAAELDLPYSIKLREKRLRIREALEACDLVIIDEAHLIEKWALSAQADFWDYLRTDIHANGARGVVLIATNQDLLKSIQRFRRASGYNIGQLLGRMRNEVQTIDPAEDITEADVRLLIERYYKPSAATVRKLHDYATREGLGHFGLLDDILNKAWTCAKARKRDLTDDVVEKTAAEIIAQLESRKEMYQ